MAHNRKFVQSSVDLVRCRIKNDFKVRDRDKVEKLIIESGFLENAPFKWVSLNYLYGLKNNLKLKDVRISKRYGDISFSLELDTNILDWADWENLKLLHDIFMIAILEALIQIGEKYKLKLDLIRAERAKYGNIPETIEECEKYPKE